MPKIRMLRDDKGSADGFSVSRFEAGREYDVPESLAEAFVTHRRSAVRVADAAPAPVVEPKKAAAVEKPAPAPAEAPTPLEEAIAEAPAPGQSEAQEPAADDAAAEAPKPKKKKAKPAE